MTEQSRHKVELSEMIEFDEFQITEARFGWITSIDQEKEVIMVDYEGNPFNQPIPAKPGRPFLLQDLKKALKRVQSIRIDFEANRASSPVISDIYYSVFDQEQTLEETQKKEIHIQAQRIILEGAQEVLIKSGSVSTRYTAKTGKLKEQAEYVSSNARISNKIKGGSVSLN